LGAGFSKAVHDSMPNLKELSIKVKEKCTGVFSLPPPVLDLGDDIELWLTYLSQPQPWLKETDNLQNRAIFLHMTEVIGQVLDETTKEAVGQNCPEWLCSLVKYWNAHKSSIITLNYDTLIERVAGKNGIATQNIYPVGFTDVRRNQLFPCATLQDSFKLFKLHGSVNWHYSGAASFYGEVLYVSYVAGWGPLSDDAENQLRVAASDKVPLIVPPTSEKISYFQHETLRQIWHRASEVLKAATCVYCIGYSLPTTDLGIRFFLIHGKPNGKIPLSIVNIKNENIDVAKHYQDLLDNSYNIDGKYATTGVEAFVEDLLKDIL